MRLPAALLALAVATPVLAGAPPVAAFFGEPAMSDVSLSPQGGYVAFLYTGADGRQAVGIRATADLTKLTVAGAAVLEYARITSIHWINEGRIGFTVKDMRIQFEGNLDEFAADRNGGNLTHLISGNWHHRSESTGSLMKDRKLTADYAYAGPTHDGSDDVIVEKYLWNNLDYAPESSRLYRLNTKTRLLADLLPGTQPARVGRWLLDMDDTPRIATSVSKGQCSVSYRDKGATAWTELSSMACYGPDRVVPEFFDGRNTLYVTAIADGYTALYAYDVAQRRRGAEPLVRVDGFDFDGEPVIDYQQRGIVGLHLAGDANATVWFAPAMKEAQQKIDALLPGRINRIDCSAACGDGRALLVTSTSDRTPPGYFLYHPGRNDVTALGSAHPAIETAAMGRRDFHRFKARDGLSIPVYVTMPAGKTKGPLPAVVLVHGGPSVRGTSWEWQADAQFLASRGYLVLQPEFRGSTGYGAALLRAGWREWGRTMQDDLADAAQWAVQQGWADPRRIAIAGGSYGGYATLMGLIRHPEIFRCGVEWAGVTDIGLMFTSAQSDASREALQYSMRTVIGDPDTEAARLQEVSPIAQAARLTRPLLIAHGAEDRRVPLEHANKLRSALRHNSDVEYVVYPEEGHGWRHEKDRLDFWMRVEAFLGKHLQ